MNAINLNTSASQAAAADPTSSGPEVADWEYLTGHRLDFYRRPAPSLTIPDRTHQRKSSPVIYRDPRLHIDAELARLEALPAKLAARHLGWRLIEAFVARDPEQLLFWSVAFTKYEGAKDAEIAHQVLSTTAAEPGSRN